MVEEILVEIDLNTDADGFLYDMSALAKRFVKERMKEVKPEDMGLDGRAARRLYVDETAIVAHVSDDRLLQYYGGFEYVDKEYRSQVGDYVFYSVEDSRVSGHLSRVMDGVESGDEDYED